jgi:hypothetical protein
MDSKQQFLEQQQVKQEQSLQIRRQQELNMITRSLTNGIHLKYCHSFLQLVWAGF